MSVDTASPTGAKPSRVKAAGLWVVTSLLACLFVLAGVMKFVNPEMAEHFVQWGYPDWFRILIGVVEVGGALVLLLPRTACYAAGALAVVMAGAVFTHLLHGEASQTAVPFVLLGLLVLVGYARRPRTLN
jgi:putative oxidoreductase